MKLPKPPAAIETNEIGMPRFLRGGQRGALLVHGYTGVAEDMAYLGGQLHAQGFTVSIPRLPGHGTVGLDFAQTNGRDWFRRVVDAWADLRHVCDSVSVCGLSMGGILASLLASYVSVERLVLAAPALKVTNPLLPLAPIVGAVVPRKAKEHTEEYEDQRYAVNAREYWMTEWYRQAGYLHRLGRKAKRRLRHITCPTLTIVSEQDRLVPLAVADLIQQRIGSDIHRTLRLNESPHVVVNECERERVAEAVLNWLQSDEREL